MNPEVVRKIIDEINKSQHIKGTAFEAEIKRNLEEGEFDLAQAQINELHRRSASSQDAPDLMAILKSSGGEEAVRADYHSGRFEVNNPHNGVFEPWEAGQPMPNFDINHARKYFKQILPFLNKNPTPPYRGVMPGRGTQGQNTRIEAPAPVFNSPITGKSTYEDAIRDYSAKSLTRTPQVYRGDLQAPLSDVFKDSESKAARLARQAFDNQQNDPSSAIFQEHLSSKMGDTDLKPFSEGMKGVSTPDLLKIVDERGLSKGYVDEAVNEARRIFDSEIAPGISSRFVGHGRAFDSSSRLAAIEHNRQKYLENARMKARQEDRELKRSELSEAYKQLTGGREQAMAASANKQGALNTQATRQLEAARALQENQRHHLGLQSETMGNELKLAGVRTAHNQTDLDHQHAKWKEAVNQDANNINTMVAVNTGLKAEPPQNPNIAVPIRPNPYATMGVTGANMLAHLQQQPPQQAASVGGLIRGYAKGGQVHLPPNFSEGEMGMEDAELIRERQLGEELAARQGNPQRAYWANMAKAFAKPGDEAYANAVTDAHNAMSTEEDKPYAGKLASATIMGRIHQSRQDQKKALMEYHRHTDRDLWERSHKAKELALETEKARGTLLSKSNIKVGDREKLSKAAANHEEYNDILSNLDTYEDMINKNEKIGGGILSTLTSSPTILSGTGYAEKGDLKKLKQLDDKINNDIQMLLDTDKSLDKETRENAKKLMNISNTGLTREDLKLKIRLAKHFIGKKQKVSAGTLGDDISISRTNEAPSMALSLDSIMSEKDKLASEAAALKEQYGF